MPKRLQDMTEPELKSHVNDIMKKIKQWQRRYPDVIGCILVAFQDDGITQYGATIDPETAPAALRELADRLENRETVRR